MVINASAAVTLHEQRPEKNFQALSGIRTVPTTSAMPVQCSQLSYQSHMRAVVYGLALYMGTFRANISTISEQIFRRRWKFIGHVLRMADPNKHPKTALTWAPEGRRIRGRPKENWRRTAERERAALGFNSWSEATVTAHDRVTWRRRVSGPIPT